MNNKKNFRLATAGLILCAGLIQSCEKDVLTGQPEWLGNSIYERLQDGIETNDGQLRSFRTTLRLIDDLGYTETLSRTGSKTIFATPDDVFDKWLKEKHLTYEQLTLTQKKQLFNSAMVNNAYLIELMSNVTGNPPVEGSCLRRSTAASIYDSIPTLGVEEMPVNPLGKPEWDVWAPFIEKGKGLYVCKDATSAPMIHFLPSFMHKNNITDEDLKIISNGESNSIDDAWISGKKVISKEQTCKNGYIYVVDGVIEGAPNMAEELHRLPNTKMWAQALDRFSCPEEMRGTQLTNFQNAYNTTEKLYNLRYFNSSANHTYLKGASLEDNLNASGVLRIDPGWNAYSVTTTGQDMHYDAAVMIVPTDEAVEEWFNNGGGKDLKARFGSWENIDYETLSSLLNVNMLESFIGSVPSKFSSVLDYNSQRELGIETSDIQHCYMCCNGIIYLVNKVYAPDTYSTVIYPSMLETNGKYSVTYHALTGYYSTYSSAYDFSPYLSSMDSRFTIILPYNVAESGNPTVASRGKVFRTIDPCTFGMSTQKVLEFYYYKSAVKGASYDAVVGPNGLEVDYTKQTELSEDVVKNRLYDLIDNNIIVGDIVEGQTYYKTKTGGVLKAFRGDDGMMHIDGGYQIENGETIAFPDSCIVDKGTEGNGVTYGACSADAIKDKLVAIPMTATKSVYQILQEESFKSGNQSSLFFKLLAGSSLLAVKEGNYECAGSDNMNINIFDSYNYTVYVPTDAAIQELIDKGYLPTWEMYDELQDLADNGNEEAEIKRTVIANRINNFLRYHIQDKSVYMDGGNVNQEFETGKLNPATNRFYSLSIMASGKTSLTVTDHLKNTRHAVTDGEFYNKFSREYWIQNKGKATALLASSSFAVIHQIDGVLLYDNSQLTSWEDEARATKK